MDCAAVRAWSWMRLCSAASAWQNPLRADQGQRNPDRQQESRQDQEEFGGRRKSGEPAGNAHRADKPESGSLAELTNEVEKVVGNGFAQSIVVNRAQRAAEIGRSLLARILVGRLRLLRTLCVRRFIRVASLPGTQPLVPLTRA